jgi:adenylate cyclase
MATEIERKFLVTGENWPKSKFTNLRQGYLNRDPKRTVRVRIAEDRCILTIKGSITGFSRPEFEYEIPSEEAEGLLEICDGPLIEKKRYLVQVNGLTWEVDEFLGANQGLVLAELELDSEDQEFEIPDWIGSEVTDDGRYYNSNLVTNPYRSWGNQIPN